MYQIKKKKNLEPQQKQASLLQIVNSNWTRTKSRDSVPNNTPTLEPNDSYKISQSLDFYIIFISSIIKKIF